MNGLSLFVEIMFLLMLLHFNLHDGTLSSAAIIVTIDSGDNVVFLAMNIVLIALTPRLF